MWGVAIGTTAFTVCFTYLGFIVIRWTLIDFQVFSRWEHQTVAADTAMIDYAILPAIEAYARREGRLPASLDDLVAAGDLAYVPLSQAGEWFFTVRADAFTIGVGDPPHRYPSAYRVVETEGPTIPDPIGWRVRDWDHDS